MAAMSKQQIRDRCKIRFRDQSNHIYDDVDWNYYIEATDSEINQAENWPQRKTLEEDIAVVAGDATFLLGGGQMISVRSIWDDTHERHLMPIYNWDDVKAMFPNAADTDQRGEPHYYYVGGTGLIYLFPRPIEATTFHVEYMAGDTGFTGDSDTPWYPDMYHPMLVDGALSKAYLDDGNVPQAEIYEAKFRSSLERMKIDLLGQREGRNHPLRDDWWD